MTAKAAAAVAFVGVLAAGCAAVPGMGVDDGALRVVSNTTIGGFGWPESVGCDTGHQVLYVSQFGGSEPKPPVKDGNGYISKVALDGKVIEKRFLPASGEILNKPKGIWIEGDRLWVTDIDVMWVYDLATRKGRKIDVPGAKFLNDPTVRGGVLYVSDNRTDQLFRIEPADYLDAAVRPKITVVMRGDSINPNGLYPAKDGSLLMVGMAGPKDPRGIYRMERDGDIKLIARPIGHLDGLYEMRGGMLLATDWDSGSLFRWSVATGVQQLAGGFKGPADICAFPQADGYTVYVPDLMKGEVRIVRLGR
jgi:hypothetical protein